jgi:hypothetical protein
MKKQGYDLKHLVIVNAIGRAGRQHLVPGQEHRYLVAAAANVVTMNKEGTCRTLGVLSTNALSICPMFPPPRNRAWTCKAL